MPIGKRRLPANLCTAIVQTANMHGDISSGQRICYDGYDTIVDRVADGQLNIDAVSAELAVGILGQLPDDAVRAATASNRQTVAAAARALLAQREIETTDPGDLTAGAIARARNKPVTLIRVLARDGIAVNAQAAEVICPPGTDKLGGQVLRALEKATYKGIGFTDDGAHHLAEHGGPTVRAILFRCKVIDGVAMRRHAHQLSLTEAVTYFDDDTDAEFVASVIERFANDPSVAARDNHHKLYRIPERWIQACNNDARREALLSICSLHGLGQLVTDGSPLVQNTSKRIEVIDDKLDDPKVFWRSKWRTDWIEKMTVTNVAQLELISDVIDRLDHVPAAALLARPVWAYGIAHKARAAGLGDEQQHIAFMLMKGDMTVNDAIEVAGAMGAN